MADGVHPSLVEITGVAGAGKSTLTRLLRDHHPGCSVADFLHTRNARHLGYVAHGLPRLAPILAANLAAAPRLSWPDVKLLVYVSEWHRFLERDGRAPGRITLFDQGPIYALVRLRAQDRAVARTAAFARWWNRMLEGWARKLDAVVYLDAADPVLWERINGRRQPHGTKGEPAEVVHRFVGRYRRLFEEVLDRLEVPGGPRVLRFDTSATSLDRIAADLRPFLSVRGADPLPDAGARR